MLMKKYEFIDHTADIGLVAYGKDLRELFENAACGMFDLITDAKKVKSRESREIKIEAENLEELLVSWLRELLFQYDANEFLFGRFRIKEFAENSLCAECSGEKMDLKRHVMRREVKAVTYHNLKVEKIDSDWQASVIFDI